MGSCAVDIALSSRVGVFYPIVEKVETGYSLDSTGFDDEKRE